jgi:hypothetical protein
MHCGANVTTALTSKKSAFFTQCALKQSNSHPPTFPTIRLLQKVERARFIFTTAYFPAVTTVSYKPSPISSFPLSSLSFSLVSLTLCIVPVLIKIELNAHNDLDSLFVEVSSSHTHTHTETTGSTPLNKRSARRKGRNLHDTKRTQEIRVRAINGIRTSDARIKRLHAHALDCTATGIGSKCI